MNFFEAQDKARKRSRWLALWFLLAVVCTIASLCAVTFGIEQYYLTKDQPQSYVVYVGIISALIILGGTSFKLMQLGQGGSVVARDMGARPVDTSTRDVAERRLLNVVEEMSIASGIPAPQVWIMDDENVINAFAAGTEPSNAVIAVTRGCLDKLNRAELQGVVAHEFSHILNGDMRLNLRLIGWIFGLLMIAILGRHIFSLIRHVRISSSRDEKGGSAAIYLVIIAIGVSTWAVGSIGVFFGRLLQAAISRQREYLADASAVQFTRDPEGIGGALKKSANKGAGLLAPKAAEARHMMFASGSGWLDGLMATHPPIEARIKAIDPAWDKTKTFETPATAVTQWKTSSLIDVGDSRGVSLLQSAEISRNLEPEMREGMSLAEAKALVLAMLVAQDETLRREELSWLQQVLTESEMQCLESSLDRVATMQSLERIGALDLALPVLRRMNVQGYQVFRDAARHLIASDKRVTLFEFMVERAMERHLDSHYDPRSLPPMRWTRVSDVREPLEVLLSALGDLGDDPAISFQAGAKLFSEECGQPMSKKQVTLEQLDEALRALDQSTPLVKRRILQLAGMVVSSDGRIGCREFELLRATADAFGTMLPPLPADQATA